MDSDHTIIINYFPELTELQVSQFAHLKELYGHWNSKINIISRKDIGRLYERHVLHSLGIAQVIRFMPGTQVLDIGTGGGFPGIPLAIFFPDCRFHMVDSVGKKIKVVNAITEELGLENTAAEQIRAEKVSGQYDFIVSRAVSALEQQLTWMEGKICSANFNYLPNGLLCLKGGDLANELKPVKRDVRVFGLSEFFQEDFFAKKRVVYVRV